MLKNDFIKLTTWEQIQFCLSLSLDKFSLINILTDLALIRSSIYVHIFLE